jgi:hypothetical protein
MFAVNGANGAPWNISQKDTAPVESPDSKRHIGRIRNKANLPVPLWLYSFLGGETDPVSMYLPASCVLSTSNLTASQMPGTSLVADRQRNWSKEGKTERLFILFVSMILSSYLRHIWKSTNLHNSFSSSMEILDEMRPIRLIEHANRTKIITPFVGMQLNICYTFSFDMPEGCSSAYMSRQQPKRRRGHPRKKKVELDL